ncbi:MAG: hypothetical protein M1824_001990 [Vezdaea acicularis]|nr:MAG: hypothetical protein M1824_001990 [Vezdaea acicularis]
MTPETSRRVSMLSNVGGPVSGMVSRPRLEESVRTASSISMDSNGNASPSRTTAPILPSDEKPIASGNGVSASISLAEPILFLQGFDQNDMHNRKTALLRGSLVLRVTKSAKIKAVSLNFRGRARTEWPEGIPPKKNEYYEEKRIMSHTWPFFNAQFPQAESDTGAHTVNLAKPCSSSASLVAPAGARLAFDQFSRNASPVRNGFSTRDQKRLSLQVNHSRSFGRGDQPLGGNSIAQKGYRTFHPGEYIYNFELPLDSHLPETINVELGSVKYDLEVIVERAGAFRANLIGTKELLVIRAPSESSLEQVEPIAISRNWEDQLHYDIVISGKSFPLGSQIPIAFKLTPLAKVQCHRIKVYVTENIEYFCNNKRVHRLEPTRKIQLFEKRADTVSTSAYPGSSIRVLSGGGIAYDSREAAAAGVEQVTRDMSNLLGNLEGGEHNVGPTEMEFNVQLPSCHSLRDSQKSQRLHFDTTYGNIQVHHWIKIVMRLSKPDATDSSKRRHFEISIDSPFHILSCRATQANTSLPAYSLPNNPSPSSSTLAECGCPGARHRAHSLIPHPHIHVPNPTPHASEDTTAPAPPALAHAAPPHNAVQRPMHIIRNPSFNPPAFDAEDPPPALMTPPPQYDSIVRGGGTEGLADYFARLADEEDDRQENWGRNMGRMDLPLTPGGRINRSMDEPRTWLPVARGT